MRQRSNKQSRAIHANTCTEACDFACHPPIWNRHRQFSTLDPDISYPDNGGTISGTVLFILVFVFPAVVITGITLSQRAWVDWCVAERERVEVTQPKVQLSEGESIRQGRDITARALN